MANMIMWQSNYLLIMDSIFLFPFIYLGYLFFNISCLCVGTCVCYNLEEALQLSVINHDQSIFLCTLINHVKNCMIRWVLYIIQGIFLFWSSILIVVFMFLSSGSSLCCHWKQNIQIWDSQ